MKDKIENLEKEMLNKLKCTPGTDSQFAEQLYHLTKHGHEAMIKMHNDCGKAAQEALTNIPQENLPEGKICYMDNEYNPSCDQQCDIEEDLTQDEFYYVPDELWPEKVTPIHNQVHYLWYRQTEWRDVEAVNESNKKLIDECIAFYKKKRPEVEDPLKEDEFWLKCVSDNLISNSIENRDYIYEGDYDYNSNDFKKALKQYDVVIQETLGGYVCHPFVVYDIQYRNAYKAIIKMDEYADKILEELKDSLSDETWSSTGHKIYNKKRIELIKKGHAKYTVKPDGTEYRMNIRWVDRSKKVTPQPDGELYKSIW